MFRGGGKVSSYGTGIASGLTNQPQRYARGGSIHTPKRGIVKGPGSYSYAENWKNIDWKNTCLLYTSPSPRDRTRSRMPSSA